MNARCIPLLTILLLSYPLTSAGADASLERRKQYLDTLQKILPHSTSTQLTGRISAFDKSCGRDRTPKRTPL